MTDSIIEKMIEYNGNDVLRINHALKVYGFASYITQREKLTEREILIIDIASILHDIGIKEAERKYNSSSGKYQEIEGPAVARKLLSDMEIDNDILNRVCYLIGHHHSYDKIDGIDFQILIEADFLVNIHEDGFSGDAILKIRDNYFKTETGISLLNRMYL